MTKELVTRRKLESERDVDHLTELLNRRGAYDRFAELFKEPETLKYGAIIMIDADDLKLINDNCGHDKGDLYLQETAEMLSSLGKRNNISARFGGDEFVVLLYGYESEEEVYEDLREFINTQDSVSVHLDKDIKVPIRFSAGYSMIHDNSDFKSLIRSADEMMYENKRTRKNDR